jgi:hypothetical protein
MVRTVTHRALYLTLPAGYFYVSAFSKAVALNLYVHQENVMKSMSIARVIAKLSVAGWLGAALTACVIAPVAPRHVVAVEAAPVVVAPAPPVVVVRPAVRYYPYRHRYIY